MNQKRTYSDKVNRCVVTFLIAALVVANVGFIVTFGRATLELVFVLRDYFIALTEAVQIQPKGAQNESVYCWSDSMFSFVSGSA